MALYRGFSLIWALLTHAFGRGPLAGSGVIFLTETGTFGNLHSEGWENIDNGLLEGIKSTGAQSVLVPRYGIMPQIVSVILSPDALPVGFEPRDATIIGAIG
ncbi:ABC-type phosphate/phosphonate transport system permease subunit [Rhizobium binae]|uniref:ABC-type phosphate/phosphonate transport system permease subunit n=1 Tax=Rhizobium binae TaxID=1138190 RepID=A0ABV2MK22_9HYPH